jgi:hypothetical protein
VLSRAVEIVTKRPVTLMTFIKVANNLSTRRVRPLSIFNLLFTFVVLGLTNVNSGEATTKKTGATEKPNE